MTEHWTKSAAGVGPSVHLVRVLFEEDGLLKAKNVTVRALSKAPDLTIAADAVWIVSRWRGVSGARAIGIRRHDETSMRELKGDPA